jgi:PTH2 family peptidyl-tRNA hydrolase
MSIKQVIVIRKDLKMRRGKEIAQGSHASMAFITSRMQLMEDGNENRTYGCEFSDNEIEWINGKYAKICLQVSSEEELQSVYDKAKSVGLKVHMITDAGATEFHGVPTKTCLAIGPDDAEKIDVVTKHLSLY